MNRLLPILFAATTAWTALAGETVDVPEEMVLIEAGSYLPLFGPEGRASSEPVDALLIDRHPVTNADYLAFVTAKPRWQRSNAKRIFADTNYLKHWESDLVPGAGAPDDFPVVRVSWFAAKAYADWAGKRLPTTAEWEYVAAADSESRDGALRPEFQNQLLLLYSKPGPATLRSVGEDIPNVWGVHDMHGLVWEWVADFNTAMVTGDARGDTGIERQLFCGAASSGATDPSNYAAFMRYAMRSSLKAPYTVNNLGFRCARTP